VPEPSPPKTTANPGDEPTLVVERRWRATGILPVGRGVRQVRSRSESQPSIDLRANDSKSDFPQPVQVPAGAPNILPVVPGSLPRGKSFADVNATVCEERQSLAELGRHSRMLACHIA
jgi:hypothetical protein